MSETCGFEIPKKLRGVLWSKSLCGLELQDNVSVDTEVGKVFPYQGSILVEDLERHLLFNLYALFPQPMSQSVFVHFFKMTVSVVNMYSIGRLANGVAQGFNSVHG